MMLLTKNPYDPTIYRSTGMVFETVIVSSSIRDDLDVFLKSFTQNTLTEYEKMVESTYTKLLERSIRKAKALGADALYNISIGVEALYPGTILLHLSGEGVSLL